MSKRTRVSFVAVALVAAVAVAVGLSACSAKPAPMPSQQGEASATLSPVRIGALPNEDSLPLWVAEKQGLFKKAGLAVTITTFPSAAERDAALTAGSIDAESADIIAAALLAGHGFPVRIATIQLGATPAEGRFGIVASPKSGLTSLADLAKKGQLAQSSGTLAGYVADKLLAQAGIDPAKVKRVEVKKLPVRYDLVKTGGVPAAVLPEPLLSLAQKDGLKLLADDTKGANISQTVLLFSQKYLDGSGASASANALLNVWNEAVAAINADPNSFRALLVDKARLPKPIADSYQISHYPTAQQPTAQQIDEVLAWMRAQHLVGPGVTSGQFTWPGQTYQK